MRIAVNLPRFPSALVHLDRLPVFLHAFPAGELLGRRPQNTLWRSGIEDFAMRLAYAHLAAELSRRTPGAPQRDHLLPKLLR